MGYRLSVVIINYCSFDLTMQCLGSLEHEIDPDGDVVVLVDNNSPDGSGKRIEKAILENQWNSWITMVHSPVNGGFSWGNNVGIQAAAAEFYLLLNSDTIVRPGALAQMLNAMDQYPEAGLISPRLEWPDASPQISCFNNHTPLSQTIDSAGTGPVTRLLKAYDVPIKVSEIPITPPWTSFACVMIRCTVIETAGLMDDDYFMYFEDNDYCRRVWDKGWKILHWPRARVVHLRGGSSSVKSSLAQRRRLPHYFYASRTRYFAKFYGTRGLLAANLMWAAGWLIARLREAAGNKQPHNCEYSVRDTWIQFSNPLEKNAALTQPEAANPKNMKTTPDFIIIGAMKCATSTLHDQLAVQPGILMSDPKEPNFFSNDDIYAQGLEWYGNLFKDADDNTLCGESSTHYTKLPTYPDTITRMQTVMPALKLIYVMRHPIDRLVSQYIHHWTEKEVSVDINRAVTTLPILMEYSMYTKQLTPFITAYGQENILPVFFDSLVSRPQHELERVCRFLGYGPSPQWDLELQASNVSSQRLQVNALRDAVVDNPVVTFIRRKFIPQRIRDLIKKPWQMEKRPMLTPETTARLKLKFDEDLKTLGTWMGITLNCDNFKAVGSTLSDPRINPAGEYKI